jgi:hypothetical protein
MTDPLLRRLADLPTASLEASRRDRIRDRCHAALARRRPRPARAEGRQSRVWTSIVAGFGGVYITALLRHALAVYGFV